MPEKHLNVTKPTLLIVFIFLFTVLVKNNAYAACETCSGTFDVATSDGLCAYNGNGCASTHCGAAGDRCADISSRYTSGEWRWDNTRSILYCTDGRTGTTNFVGRTCDAGCISCPADPGDDDPGDSQHSPTGFISSYPASTPSGNKLKVGQTYTFGGTGHDDDSNLDKISLLLRRLNQSGSVFTLFNGEDGDCSGRDCESRAFTWTPQPSDLYRPNTNQNYYGFIVNVYDSSSPVRQCTGNPVVPSGWSDCDSTDDSTRDYREYCVYVCPRSNSGGFEEIILTNPANNSLLSSTSTVNLGWLPINFGSSCSAYTPRIIVRWRISGGAWNSATLAQGATSHTINVVPNTPYEWYVEASNGEVECGAIRSETRTFRTNYEQPTRGRITALGGSVFAPLFDQDGPTNPSAANDFIPAYLADVFLPSDVGGSVLQANNGPLRLTRVTARPNNSLGKLAYSGAMMWQPGTTALDKLANTANPANDPSVQIITAANANTTRNNLNPNRVYVAQNHTALSTFFNGSGSACTAAPNPTCNYTITQPGVVVIYYMGPNPQPINIDSNFQNSNSSQTDRRVLFVTTHPIRINKDIETPNPTKSSRANLEMGLVSTNEITFSGEITAGQDLPIVVEGPVISESVRFNRVTQFNVYPGEIIRYNPLYLTAMHRISTDYSHLFPGLFTSEITWEDSL